MQNQDLIPVIVKKLDKLLITSERLESRIERLEEKVDYVLRTEGNHHNSKKSYPENTPSEFIPQEYANSKAYVDPEIIKDDFVKVLNKRNGLQGKIFKATRATETRIFFKVDGKETWRSRSNTLKVANKNS